MTYPGATAPDREYTVDSSGVAIAVHEWGVESDPPLFCVHGGFDFARTFDVFAPRIAAQGFRVVAWDHRGHGDSEHASLYSWDADLRDATAVMDAVTRRPAPVVAHSKGGALMIQLADAQPFRFSHMVNLDGIPYRRRLPDVSEHERTSMLASDVAAWLDHRRRTSVAQRKPGTLDELATRRGHMNPRLDHDWLRYLVTVGARRDADGWRWKIDPTIRMGGFGPWRPEWTILRLAGWACRSSASSAPSSRRWAGAHSPGTSPRTCPQADGARCSTVSGTSCTSNSPTWSPRWSSTSWGCRVSTAANTVWLQHNRIRLALHELKGGTGRALLLLHGLGEHAPTTCPTWAPSGPVRSLRSTSPATARRPLPRGAGTAPRSSSPMPTLPSATWVGSRSWVGAGRLHRAAVGRCPGGRRARCGAVRRRRDVGGAVGMSGQSITHIEATAVRPTRTPSSSSTRTCDPPDYATLFVRLAVQGSGLTDPISVVAVHRPPWLAAVAGEPGVVDSTLSEALARYA